MTALNVTAVTTFTVTIDGKPVELSREDAVFLRDALNKLLGKTTLPEPLTDDPYGTV